MLGILHEVGQKPNEAGLRPMKLPLWDDLNEKSELPCSSLFCVYIKDVAWQRGKGSLV